MRVVILLAILIAMPGIIGLAMGDVEDDQINYDMIIDRGMGLLRTRSFGRSIETESEFKSYVNNLDALANWYGDQPDIAFATHIDTTITIKFVDGFYTMLFLNPGSVGEDIDMVNFDTIPGTSKSAVILDGYNWQLGGGPVSTVESYLEGIGYEATVYRDEEVDISCIENELDGNGVIYNRGHGGFFDQDGDEVGDTVVLAIGEHWTDNTPELYPEEYENGWILRGGINDGGETKYFVAFTPGLIKNIYGSGDFLGTFIYAESCLGTANDSMANAFLDNGAKVYIGWDKSVLVNTGDKSASKAFKLLCVEGYTAKEVCDEIGYGDFTNQILTGSKQTFFGDGSATLI